MNGCAVSGASRTSPPETRGAEALRRHLLHAAANLSAGSRLWVAYSGGRDSHVLLHALASLRTQFSASLAAVHINHGLHADANDWEAHCSAVCKALNSPLEVRRLQLERRPGQSLEESARRARWAAWQPMLNPGDELWTAHHQDDQAETLLLALLRGAGVAGLAAMPATRPLGAGLVRRPLLTVPADALADYAGCCALAWIEDPSNRDVAFDRNYLRHQVMPRLKGRWPAMTATFARSAAHCAEAARLIDLGNLETLAGARGQLPGSLSLGALRALGPERRRALVRHWLVSGGFRVPNSRRLGTLCSDFLSARADASPLVAWEGCEVRRYRDDLVAITPLPRTPAATRHYRWDSRQPLVLDDGLGVLEVATTAGPLDLQVRFAQTGLRCRPRLAGPSRSLKALFQEAGVPSWLRPYVPLVFRRDDLLAIAGVSLCGKALAELRWRYPWHHGFGLREVIRAQ